MGIMMPPANSWLVGLLSLLLGATVMAQEPIKPIPIIAFDKDKAYLGEQLFSDVRLSKDDSISCASCHKLDQYGVDNESQSVGVNGTKTKRNTPTIYNAALNLFQLWDGRERNLESRVKSAVISPALMGMESWDKTVAKLSAIEAYQTGFSNAYSDGITAENVQHAMAEYQQSLVLVNSPFDQYLRGNENAISDLAKQGYQLFKDHGCISCHQGANVGGNLFQKMGVLEKIDWKKWNDNDLGRHHITGKEWDKHVFKVPSLRLAVKTAPYFHNGSVDSLDVAIYRMINYQLGREVLEEDKNAIIAFLETLPGELPQGDEQ